jgi:methyl acetate hydrolase
MPRAGEVDRALGEAVESRRVPGVAAVVTNRRGPVYEGAFGLARTAERRAMQLDTVCRIASMTKLVTTLGILMLVEEGRIALDEPFKRCFPDFRQPEVLVSFDAATRRYATRPAAHHITVRELLTHTSGYGYWFLSSELYALKALPPEYYNPPFLLCDPGSRFVYGTGTDVLGQAIPAVTGEPLADFFARRIFGPLSMRDTSFEVPRDAARLASRQLLAAGFSELDNETVGEGPHGGGGLYSTVQDYAKLLRLLLNGGEVDGVRLLQEQSLREMTRNQVGAMPVERQLTAVQKRSDDFRFMDGTQKFGFNVLIETRRRPSGRAAGSYGWGGLYNTYFWVDPSVELAAALFMQISPFSAPVCVAVCERFEAAVFAALGGGR